MMARGETRTRATELREENGDRVIRLGKGEDGRKTGQDSQRKMKKRNIYIYSIAGESIR